jgi:hypothetical protein
MNRKGCGPVSCEPVNAIEEISKSGPIKDIRRK